MIWVQTVCKHYQQTTKVIPFTGIRRLLMQRRTELVKAHRVLEPRDREVDILVRWGALLMLPFETLIITRTTALNVIKFRTLSLPVLK